MALVTCKECGKSISDTANSCPSCGAKLPKKTGAFTKFVAGFIGFAIVMGIIGSVIGSNARDKEAQAEALRVAALTPEQRAAESKSAAKTALAEQQLEQRNTRAVDAMASIRKNLRNPASVQWDEIRANDTGSILCISYRAQNGFGGLNVDHAAVVGDKIQINNGAWNTTCTQKLWVVSGAPELLAQYDKLK